MAINRLANALRTLGVLTGSLAANTAFAGWGELNMTRGVTPISQQQYDLHMIVFWICVAIGVVVFGAIVYSVINHRRSQGAEAAQFHENTTVEVLWTVVPIVILVAVAVPATSTLLSLEDTSDADMTVQITGYQWKWKYDYLGEDLSFFSNLSQESRDGIKADPYAVENYLLDVDKPLVLPIKKKVRFVMTSADVIHAWWVPDLGVKQDTIPGFINDSWAYIEEPGVYRGQCAELCGKDHGFMPIVVIAKAEPEYNQWVADQKAAAVAAAASADREWTRQELMAKGEEVYNSACASCHQANGQGIPGVFPGMVGSAITTGPVEDHIDIVVNGKPGTAMQAFGEQLTAAEVAAVVTYERNAWGIDTGDVVQPTAIAANK
ncbi:MAG: cytochrome c oxidase subunit II [Gammaproteobacteria bacterium]|nr:cytochrome c oxidase subunit II [Gammaproteobacteria bacterium]